MGKYKKRYKQEKHPVKYVPFLLTIIVVVLTMGYSSISDILSVSNAKAYVRLQKDIRITGLRVSNTSNGGSTTYDEYSYANFMSGVSLPNADSTVTFEVQVTNLGNAEMGIHEIIGLPSNMEYTLNGYSLEATLCDSNNNSVCTLGSVTTFTMTIGYTENGYNSASTSYNLDIELDFQEMIYTARIGNHYYETIQDAINDAPTDGTLTTIVLLKNVYQRIQIWRGNNIVLDMPNLVLHNKEFASGSAGDPVVEIFGARDKQHKTSDDTNNVGVATFRMINGSIITEANQGAVNVEMGGTFIMTGGSILASGNRQAVYIRNGGSAFISGTSYLRASAELAPTASPPNYRATIHNVSGTLTITGGTFEAVGTDGIALTSESTTTIGSEDGTVSTTSPTFIANSMGAYIKSNTTFNFYDGVFKGKAKAFNNESEIDDIESGYDLVHSSDVINNNSYYTTYLGHGVTLTFDYDGGTQGETTRVVAPNAPVGPLPETTKSGFGFDGWYDANGNLMSANSTINANAVFTARWIDLTNYNVAKIGTSEYLTIQEALTHVPTNTETTITIIRDAELSEIITIPSNKNVVVDLNDHTIDTTVGTVFRNEGILKIDDTGTNGTGVLTGGMVSGGQVTVINNRPNATLYVRGGTITSNRSQVIDNNGMMYITGGKITINFDQGVINNNNGATLNMSGGEITVTVAGSTRRQAIYNKGTVNISGDAVLSSASKDRATLQNDASGAKITISGGTIISTNTNCSRGAVQNGSGTLTVTGGLIISNSNNGSTGVSGIQNSGTCIIGVEGGGIDTMTPVIRGVRVGVYNSGTLDIFDGVLQSPGTPLSGSTRNIEYNSVPVTNNTTQIGGVTYNLWYLQSTN